MLAPGLMISACGLLLLGINNKYSIIVNRIRLLNEEKRKMKRGDRLTIEQNRMDSLILQINKLYNRFKLVRNAAFSYSIAVVLFIIASLFIGLKYLLQSINAGAIALIFFLLGITSVLLGIIFAVVELWKGYKIVHIEVHDSE